MRLHHGGVLHRDVFFPFPTGELLPTRIAYTLDAPGVVLARALYAAFNVVLCLALYLDREKRGAVPMGSLGGEVSIASRSKA